MNAELNIYKCSGVGKLRDLGIYAYWTAGTSEYLNTIAFNEQLAMVNLRMSEYDIADTREEASAAADLIDLHILILQGLVWHKEDETKYALSAVRDAIGSMVADGSIGGADGSDEERAARIETLVQMLRERLDGGTELVPDSDFAAYFDERVTARDYNALTESARERLNDWFANPSGRVGTVTVPSTDPSDYKTMSDYIKGAGQGFMYLWIDNPEKYGATIRRRIDKENEMLNYIVKNTAGMYTREQVLATVKSGIIETYKMTPERRLELLRKNGSGYLAAEGEKVGVADWIIAMTAIISAVITILQCIVACVQETMKAKYNAPDDYSYGVPREDEDFNIGEGSAGTTSTSAIVAVAAAGAAALYYLSKD